MVQSILTRSVVPKTLWPKGVAWSIHILNRSPTLSVQNMTPEEAWSGRKPCINHFRIFGCVSYAHIPSEKRKKLDDKGEKCVFLDVSDQSKAYKLYNPNTKKIVNNRDVFYEEVESNEKAATSKHSVVSDFEEEVNENLSQQIFQLILLKILNMEFLLLLKLMSNLVNQQVHILIVLDASQHGCQIMR